MKKYFYTLCIALTLCFITTFSAHAQDTTLTNLPCLYITTENGAPIVSKDDYINGKLTVAGGSPDSGYYSGDIEIRGRGNSTWSFAKKPYKMKLASKYNLLGMPAKAKTWVLLANYADKTLMRNAVAFEAGKFFGFDFTPAYRMADVVLNGDYIGTYMITDQIEQDDNRVPVEELESEDTALPAISGGYLIETGWAPLYDDNPHYTTDKGMGITIDYPDDPDDINDEQRSYIVNYVQQFENSLFAPDFKDPVNGYRKYADMKSLVDGYLLNELCSNSDCFWSNYMHKYRDNPALYTGPMWDYDIAFDNDSRLGDTRYKYMRDWAHDPKMWITRLMQDEGFYQNIRKRWFELQRAGIVQRLQHVTDSLTQLLNQSQKLNYKRWPTLHQVVYLELEARGSYKNEVQFLKGFINTHSTWLTEELTGIPSQVPLKIVSQQTNKAWEIQSQQVTNGAQVVQYTNDNSRPSQRWKVTNLNNGYYTITNLYSGKALTNRGSQYADTVLRQTANDASNFAQQWRIINTGNRKYGIINRLSSLAADNYGERTENNNPVIQWYNGIYDKINQRWLLKYVPVTVAADTAAIAFTLSPNPATGGNIVIQLKLAAAGTVQLFMYNNQGIMVKEIDKGKLPKSDTYFSVSAAGLHTGSYTVSVKTGNHTASQLLIVK